MITRRQFLTRAALAVPLVAAGPALAELLVPQRTIFLPPRGGWATTPTTKLRSNGYTYTLYEAAINPAWIVDKETGAVFLDFGPYRPGDIITVTGVSGIPNKQFIITR